MVVSKLGGGLDGPSEAPPRGGGQKPALVTELSSGAALANSGGTTPKTAENTNWLGRQPARDERPQYAGRPV